MEKNNLLVELRNRMKDKKPVFIRQDNPKRPKLKDVWRKPKGIHSKIRHHFKGRRKMPSPGYKSPAEAKGLHATGLQMVRVYSPEDVADVKKESQGIIIPTAVGRRKKLEILRKAKEMDVAVLNLNIAESIKKIEDFISSKKKKETKEARKEPVKDAKKDEPQANENKEMTGEQKKEAEKKEKDKVLTQKV